jgi:hypothetical protein
MGVSVSPYVTPTLSVSANPGTVISGGQTVIFTATITGGGANPELRWLVNSRAVAIIRGLTWTSSTLRDGDVVSAELVSGARCATLSPVSSANTLRMSVSTGTGTVVAGNMIGSVSLYPNPATGMFTVSVKGGNSTVVSGRRIKLEVLNMLGQAVYQSAVVPDTRDWSVDVRLDEGVANGIYLLRVGAEDADSNTASHARAQPSVIRFEVRR